MFRNQKGQGMTEFALILPLLLLLLLGIIEAGRTIWAFITVQQAAREAARFAVTGRPYLDGSGNVNISDQMGRCLGIALEADPFVESAEPWQCEDVISTTGLIWNPRVEAIKRVAVGQGQTLAVSRVCFTPAQYHGEDPDECNDHPGAFGVLIQGQVTTETITGALIIQEEPVEDHPGFQGLNIQVNTFYNLQMITPIFDALMGGNYIPLRGRVQLQNEGLDAAAGIEPPPGIAPPPTLDPNIEKEPPSSARIWPSDGDLIKSQADTLVAHLDEHTGSTPYDIYLEDVTDPNKKFRICENKTTNTNGNTNPDPICYLGSSQEWPSYATTIIPDGTYRLYSTDINQLDPVAIFDQQIIVQPGGAPFIEVADGILATGETTEVTLRFHDVLPGTSYEVVLLDPDRNLIQTLVPGAQYPAPNNHTGASTDIIDWTAPDVSLCTAIGTSYCIIQSIKTDGGGTSVAAEFLVKVNQPQITLVPSSSPTPYRRGQPVSINLRGHTPGKRYEVSVPPSNLLLPFDVETNGVGDSVRPVTWYIPQDCGTGGGLPDGTYSTTSFRINQTTPITSATFVVQTPSTPGLTIRDGNTWPAGSTISIQVLDHVANASHYIHDIDGNKILIGPGIDTFTTGACGEATVTYTIPPGTTAGSYTLSSYNNAGTLQATTPLEVLSTPFIHVVEGDTAMPDQTITIEGKSHTPNLNYAIYYADKFLQGVLSQPDGTFSFTYDLKTLPTSPPPDLTNFANLGIPYILKSQTVVPPITEVASNTFTILGADLMVTQVIVPPVAPLSTTVPVEIVVQNLLPVTINRFVDVDFYNLEIPNPDPFGPSYLNGYNFPGDIKFWKNTVGPNEVFTFSHQILASELGLKSLYGYVDISNNVFENEGAGEVANPNNIGSAPFQVNCAGVTVIEDPFTDPAVSGWVLHPYGNGDGSLVSGGPVAPSRSASGGVLSLTSAGQSTWGSDDDASNRGQTFLYRTGTFSSSAGLDVQVMISDVQLNGTGNWAKGGLEIRDSIDPTSPRVVFGVAKRDGDTTDPRQVMQAGYRNTGNTMDWVGGDNFWLNNHRVDLVPDAPTTGPIWMRITREPGANGAFNLYYVANPSGPVPAITDDAGQQTFWGSPKQSVSVSGMGNNLVVGLFNSPYSANVVGTSQFGQFSIATGDSSCDDGTQGPTQPTFPPNYEACTQVLKKISFEETSLNDVWGHNGSGVTLPFSGDGNIGTRSVEANSWVGAPANPNFWQQFTMPDWIINGNTTFKLDLFTWIDSQGSNQLDDEFTVKITTNQNPNTGTTISDEVIVATGVDNKNWTEVNIPAINVAGGINSEDYAGSPLYVHFIDDSFATGGCGGGGLCTTTFRFDDIKLNVCTTQPPPSPVTTRIKGTLNLNFSNGTSQALPFVKVWAYAEGVSQGVQPVYETFSIQNGQFDFYNLPIGNYTIYSQYNLVEGTTIETLADDTTVTLTTNHTDSQPAQVFLSLFSLGTITTNP